MPVQGACFPSGIWKNAGHFNFVANGQRFSTTDASFHTWSRQAGGSFPAGGRGGQWFEALPYVSSAGGQQPSQGGQPTHLINTNHYTGDTGGNRFQLGEYYPSNESWAAVINESFTDYSPQFNWAALQLSDNRLFNIAWITGIQVLRVPTSHAALPCSLSWVPCAAC